LSQDLFILLAFWLFRRGALEVAPLAVGPMAVVLNGTRTVLGARSRFAGPRLWSLSVVSRIGSGSLLPRLSAHVCLNGEFGGWERSPGSYRGHFSLSGRPWSAWSVLGPGDSLRHSGSLLHLFFLGSHSPCFREATPLF